MKYIGEKSVVKGCDEDNPAYRVMSAQNTFLAHFKAKPAVLIG
jgi:hypothetical protein